MDGTRRRKQRLTLACQFCRQRRIKCDKSSPCSRCIRANVECIYKQTSLEPYQQSAERPIIFDNVGTNVVKRTASTPTKDSRPSAESTDMNPTLRMAAFPTAISTPGPSTQPTATAGTSFDPAAVRKVGPPPGPTATTAAAVPRTSLTRAANMQPFLAAKDSVSAVKDLVDTSSAGSKSSGGSSKCSSASPIISASKSAFTDFSSQSDMLEKKKHDLLDSFERFQTGPPTSDSGSLFSTGVAREPFSLKLPKIRNQAESPPTRLPSIKLLSTDFKHLEFSLHRVGQNPYFSGDEYFNVTEYGNVPFSFESFMKMEPFLKVLLPENTKLRFDMRMVPYQQSLEVFSFNEELLHLNDQILLVLPNKIIFWSLLRIFFDTCLKMFPYVIEKKFYSRITQIMGPEEFSEDGFYNLNITTKEDYLTIALGLVFTKFAHVSIFVNKREANEQFLASEYSDSDNILRKRLMQWSFPQKIVRVFDNCLSLFVTFKSNPDSGYEMSFELLQLVHYIKFYYRYVAEVNAVSEGFRDMQFIDGIIVDMTKKFGFLVKQNYCDLDPDDFRVGTRLTIFSCSSEYCFHSFLGTHNDAITYFFHPQRRVKFEKSDLYSSEELLALERSEIQEYFQVLDAFIITWNEFVPHLHRSFLELVDNSHNVNVKVLADALSQVELKSQEIYGTCFERFISDIIIEIDNPALVMTDHVLKKVLIGKYLISLEIYYINCHLFLCNHYRRSNRDLSFFYFEKRMIKMCQLFRVLPAIVLKSDYSLDFVLNTVSQLVLFKTILSFLNFIIKLQSALKYSHKLSLAPSYIAILRVCHEKSLATVKFCLLMLYELVPKYFFSWKIFRILLFYYNLSISEALYQNFVPEFKDKGQLYKESELIKLSNIATIDISIFKNTDDRFAAECRSHTDRLSRIYSHQTKESDNSAENYQFNNYFTAVGEYDIKWLNYFRTYCADTDFNPFDKLSSL